MDRTGFRRKITRPAVGLRFKVLVRDDTTAWLQDLTLHLSTLSLRTCDADRAITITCLMNSHCVSSIRKFWVVYDSLRYMSPV